MILSSFSKIVKYFSNFSTPSKLNNTIMSRHDEIDNVIGHMLDNDPDFDRLSKELEPAINANYEYAMTQDIFSDNRPHYLNEYLEEDPEIINEVDIEADKDTLLSYVEEDEDFATLELNPNEFVEDFYNDNWENYYVDQRNLGFAWLQVSNGWFINLDELWDYAKNFYGNING